MSKDNKEITGLWIADLDTMLEFFEFKADIEEKLGRTLNDDEAHDLMVKYQKDRPEIEKIILNKNKGDVKAMLTEYFNMLDLSKKKREES